MSTAQQALKIFKSIFNQGRVPTHSSYTFHSKTGHVEQFRRQTPGAFNFGKSPSGQKVLLLDPSHPAASCRLQDFPMYRDKILGVRARPVSVLERPKIQWQTPFDVEFKTWHERVIEHSNMEGKDPKEAWEAWKSSAKIPGSKSKQISMSTVYVVSKKVHKKAVIRNKIVSRLKTALSLVVIRGANVIDKEKGGPKLVLNELGRLGDQWVLPGWSYCFYPTLEVYRAPHPLLVKHLRTALGQIFRKGSRMEEQWYKSRHQSLTSYLTSDLPKLRTPNPYDVDDSPVDKYLNEQLNTDQLLSEDPNTTAEDELWRDDSPQENKGRGTAFKAKWDPFANVSIPQNVIRSVSETKAGTPKFSLAPANRTKPTNIPDKYMPLEDIPPDQDVASATYSHSAPLSQFMPQSLLEGNTIEVALPRNRPLRVPIMKPSVQERSTPAFPSIPPKPSSTNLHSIPIVHPKPQFYPQPQFQPRGSPINVTLSKPQDKTSTPKSSVKESPTPLSTSPSAPLQPPESTGSKALMFRKPIIKLPNSKQSR